MVATAAVNDTVPDGGDLREPDCAWEPIDQQADGRLLVRGIAPAVLLANTVGPGHDPPGILLTDPIDPTGEEPRTQIGALKERELEARRSTVDRQDAGG